MLEPVQRRIVILDAMSGEFSATSKASSEKEKQTFLRSKNVYGELDAMNVVNAEKEK